MINLKRPKLHMCINYRAVKPETTIALLKQNVLTNIVAAIDKTLLEFQAKSSKEWLFRAVDINLFGACIKILINLIL